MKYLSIFATTAAYTSGKEDATFGLPHVSLITSDMSLVYDSYVAPVVSEPEQA